MRVWIKEDSLKSSSSSSNDFETDIPKVSTWRKFKNIFLDHFLPSFLGQKC